MKDYKICLPLKNKLFYSKHVVIIKNVNSIKTADAEKNKLNM